MYNPEHYFAPNALKRYTLGTRNKSLKYNPDGSYHLSRDEVAGQGKGSQLAAGAGGEFFALAPRLLA